ncbi:class I SAM-dependent methyltransferase [Halorarum salinum]|uniref:Class I SAM-dependent methyltransferase n=1 Tax=Halorarum salinum TaxID=2743089 RepID=A0A7D5LB64_9EURY|nr:class I SAM-dependent methyltransferase [Halobaculum salinum]QLG62347.1 class I SAM-dependent methyltransferase [Halobaculum salinum]
MSTQADPGLPPENPAAAYGFDAAYRGAPPNWDIGRPQRAFVHLEEAGRIGRRVLEVGCGTGELSLFLARRGHEVLGIDFAPSAVAQARLKARWRRVRAHFLVWDALKLPELGVRVDAVVDSAMLHCLGDDEQVRLVDGLAEVLDPDGYYYLLCDARPDGGPNHGASLSRGEIRKLFAGREWDLEFVLDTVFERRASWNPAYLVGVRRTGR